MKVSEWLKGLLGVAILVVIAIIYTSMPMEWRRHKDIEMGNKLVLAVQNYQKTQKRLPENTETELLKTLGFQHHDKIGWQPNYQKINENEFLLIFQDGYESPYLMWQNGNWQLTKDKRIKG